MAKVIKTTFKLRRGKEAAWEKNNPVLAAGEPGFVLDKNILKIGDGETHWKDLLPVSADSAGDWDQNDETARDYIKNRTHWENLVNVSWDGNTEGKDQRSSPHFLVETDEEKLKNIYDSTNFIYKWNGSQEEYVLNRYDFKDYVLFSPELLEDITDPWRVMSILVLKENTVINYDTPSPYPISRIYPQKGLYLFFNYEYGEYIELFSAQTIKKLDIKYLPNDIQIASDDEILEILTEEDMLPVVVDTDGSILSDENNNILLW